MEEIADVLSDAHIGIIAEKAAGTARARGLTAAGPAASAACIKTASRSSSLPPGCHDGTS
jgi:hypothetical protein